MTEPEPSPRRPNRRGRKVSRWIALAAVGGVLGGLWLSSSWTNLREVDPGRFYRSGRLSAAQLQRVIDELGIRTVVNLSGRDDDEAWYRAERRVARANDVELIDVLFRTERLPHRADLIALLDAYRDAERPILVHCFSGVDRAGLASAIYQMEYMGRSKAAAMEMLSLRNLHLAWRKPAVRYLVDLYAGEAWARAEYEPCRPGYRHYDRAFFCRG